MKYRTVGHMLNARSSAEKEGLNCILKAFQDLNCWWNKWTASWMKDISSDDFKCKQQSSPTNSDLRLYGLLSSHLTRSCEVGSPRVCVATQSYHQHFCLFALTSSVQQWCLPSWFQDSCHSTKHHILILVPQARGCWSVFPIHLFLWEEKSLPEAPASEGFWLVRGYGKSNIWERSMWHWCVRRIRVKESS